MLRNRVDDVLSVFRDAIDDSRLSGVKPREADEVQTWNRGDASLMNRQPLLVKDRQANPAEICSKSSRPDDR